MSNADDRELGDDDVLLSLVGDMLDHVEPLNADFAAAVFADAFAMRSLDALVADLVHDSATSDSGTRGDDSFRTVVFSADGVDVEVEFAGDGSIHGRIEPVGATCVLETSSQELPVSLDRVGRFEMSTVGGRLRFVVALPSGRRIATPWIFR